MIKHLYVSLLLLLCFTIAARAQTCEPIIGQAGLFTNYSCFDEGVTYAVSIPYGSNVFLDTLVGQDTAASFFSILAFDQNNKVKWLINLPYDWSKLQIHQILKFKGENVLRLQMFLSGNAVNFGDTTLTPAYHSCLYEVKLDSRTGKYMGADLMVYSKSRALYMGRQLTGRTTENLGDRKILGGLLSVTNVYSGYDNSLLIDSTGPVLSSEYVLITDNKKEWVKIKLSYTRARNYNYAAVPTNFIISKNYFGVVISFKDSLYINDNFIAFNPYRNTLNNSPVPNSGILTGNLKGKDLVFSPISGPTVTTAYVSRLADDGTAELHAGFSNDTVRFNNLTMYPDSFAYVNAGLMLSREGKATELFRVSGSPANFSVGNAPAETVELRYLSIPNTGKFFFNGHLVTPPNQPENSVTLYRYNINTTQLSPILIARNSVDQSPGSPLSLIVSGAYSEYFYLQAFYKGALTFSGGLTITGISNLINTAFVRFCLSDLPDTAVSVRAPRFISSIAAYPNPVSAGGMLQLTGAPAGTRWALTSADGRQIPLAAQAGIPAQWLSIPATAAPGLYILSGTSPEGALLRSKIIVR